MKANSWRGIVLAFALASASCSDKGKGENGPTTGSTTAQSGVSQPTDANGAAATLPSVQVKHLGALADLIVADANELPRAEFDPSALTNALGKDPQKIFEWVRDRTWWAPYRGLLRGSRGVMLDRVGSNLDRAVLLGDLMRRAGYTVRLAHAQLPANRARELVGKTRPIPDQRRNPVAPKGVSAERARALEAAMPGHEKSMQQQVAASKRYSDEAEALVRSLADQLAAIVREVAKGDGADPQAALIAIQDHWWVEREDQGNWIAMDVLLPDGKVGDSLAAASATSEWNAANEAPSIPDADWHTVQIRVVIERYQDGATTESTALEAVLRPAEVLEKPITLVHLPMPWPDAIADSKADPNALKNAALWVTRWTPILRVGDDLAGQSAFTDGGDLTAISNESAAGLGASTGGGFGDFGSALGGGDEVPSYATAEWIDYEIHVPGASNQRLRRPVFDLLGPSKRAAKAKDFEVATDALKLERFEALAGRTDIMLQPCDFTAEFVASLGFARVVANLPALKELSRERDPEKRKILASDILDRVDVWGPLLNLATWRATLVGHPDSFVDRPNVLNYRVTRSMSDAERAPLRQLVDIAGNATGVRRGASRKAFEVRLEQGVADTVAEMLALGSELRMAENTASVFAMAGAGSDQGQRIGPRDTAAVQKLGWPADAAARLALDIDAGYMAVAIKQPVSLRERKRVAWWRIDPASGETIGVMDTGFHAALTEDQIKRRNELQAFYDANKYDYRFIKNNANSGYTWPKDVQSWMRGFEELYKELRLLKYPTP